jgi:hypothetical protein
VTQIRTAFRAEYDVEEAPALAVGESVFDFSAPGLAALAPAVEIQVTTRAGSQWRGRFFGGSVGTSVVLNGPAPKMVLVVASGVGYFVPVESPSEFRMIPFEPIHSVLVSEVLRTVCLVGFTGLVAIGGDGAVAWEARDLVSDGFTDAIVTGPTLVVKGYAAPESRTVATTLDLATGEVLERG